MADVEPLKDDEVEVDLEDDERECRPANGNRPRVGSTDSVLSVPRKSSEALLDFGHSDEGHCEFQVSMGLSSDEADARREIYGLNQLPEKHIPKWYIFCSLLWQPMPIMIWLAALIELILGSYLDMLILILINLGNASLSFYETTKAGNAIEALKKSLKPTCTVFRDGKWVREYDATYLVPGDLVELHAGASIPADCMVNEKSLEVDESSLTGESLPVTIYEKQIAKMGSNVAQGEVEATVVHIGKDTFFGKTAALLKDTKEYSNLQKLLLKVMIILSVLSITLCAIAFGYLVGARQTDVKEAASFAVVLLVASIPMAIEIVTTTTLAIGSKQLTKQGAIVSRLAAIEDMAGMSMLCSDKTGTLTQNKMVIESLVPISNDCESHDILQQAALGTNWESHPKDALDTLVLRCPLWVPDIKDQLQKIEQEEDRKMHYDETIGNQVKEELKNFERLELVPFTPVLKRTECTLREKTTGNIFKITKGAPHVILGLINDNAVAEKVHKQVEEWGAEGIRAIVIAKSALLNDQWVLGAEKQENLNIQWQVTGLISFHDPPREDTKDTIEKSQNYGVEVKMITGDHALIARKTAKVLEMGNMTSSDWPRIEGPDNLPMLNSDGEAPPNLVEKYGSYIRDSDGFAQVFPEHKYLIVEVLREMGFKVGMTGDGVNDAPALKRADVGIAVQGATDAARAAADIVLTKEGLGTIVTGIEVSRCIFARMKSFITYRIAATLQLLIFFFLAVFIFEPKLYGTYAQYPEEFDLEFFSIPVLYLMSITLINDGTLISIGYDFAVPNKVPERWHLPVLFIISMVIALIAFGSSLLLLWMLLDSNNPGSWFQQIGLGGLPYGQIVNAIFLKVAISDIMSLFTCRTGDKFFFQKVPHMLLVVACFIAVLISTLIATDTPCGHGEDLTTLDGIPICGLARDDGHLLVLWVWLYSLVFFFVQDFCKVMTWRLLEKMNFWNINNELDYEPSGCTKCLEGFFKTGLNTSAKLRRRLSKTKSSKATAANMENPAKENKEQLSIRIV